MRMDDLSARIERLSPAKQALLALRLKQGVRAVSAEPAMARRAREGPVAASFAQQRLWLLDQLEPNSAVYNMPLAVRIRGDLAREALGRALDEIVARHEVLRTTFALADGELMQVIGEPRRLGLTAIDLGGRPEPEREAELARILTSEARRPFDLAQDLMLRAVLVRLGARDHVLLLTVHHVASDGWSMGVLARELGALFTAFVEARPPALPALPIQYADYAVWQRQWLQKEVLERQLSYWRRQLAGLPPALELPTDRPRPAVKGYRGAKQSRELSRELTEGLKTLARRERATLFMTLLAAFQSLLSRYTGQTDVAVGTAVAGRTRVETESLIGFFVNTLPIRADLSGDPTFREVLGRVREATLDAAANQDLPFDRLVEALRPERRLDRTPLVQVMFVLQDVTWPALELPGLTLRPVSVDTATAKFDLSLSMKESAEGLSARLEYDTDLFEAESMARLLGHLETLLAGAVADPEQRLSALPLLTTAEREQLLVTWNDTRADFPAQTCLHELVEDQARRTPDACAVVFEGARLTYRQLDSRANQLAHRLRARGVGPDVLVGVCMERSLEMVVALLGVLKAGGAYVPLDAGYPAERLAFMLEDAGCPILLTQERLRRALPASAAAVLCLDAESHAIGGESEERLASGVTPENLAYVIYTSGSTGRPKGVMISHRAACNHMQWMGREFPLTDADAVLQRTAISFDASVWEFFAPLQAGARLIMARPEGHGDSAYLVEAIVEHGVTVLQLVPSLLRVLLEEPRFGRCGSLRRVLCGGEVLPVELAERFFARLDADLINLYGPTEAAIDATAWVGRRGTGHRSIPIGRPIANARVHILDHRGQPVPVGVAGELYIGGAGLARGYLHRPELTAERFVTDPFVPGARLYRTGDLARYLSDGAIEFLGRTDHQVKLRGYRIELGEIEAVLGRHPAVQAAVVLAREDAPGDRHLVAYLVAARGASPERAGLRRFLEEKLPGHMVPGHFVVLDRLPLTPNGKVDRRALPAPDKWEGQRAFVAPRTRIEETLAGIWGRILGVERVGVDDNFFDCGGHSLSAMQLVSHVREAFRVDLRLRAVFEAPTVAAMAARVTEALAPSRVPDGRAVAETGPAPSGRFGIPRRPEEGPVPLSFAQQRLWFLDQLQPGGPAYHIPWAVRLAGELDAEALRRALAAIVARHEVLSTTFASGDAGPVQVIGGPGPLRMPLVDLTMLPQAQREVELGRRLLEEVRRPFDLARDPMMRVALLRVGAAEHVLLVTVHHIAADGWSMDVLKRELGLLYAGFAGGRPAALPELRIQYADYAAWQRQWLQGEVLERQLSYWKRQLAGMAPVLELPTDRPRPVAQTFAGARRAVKLPGPLADALRALSRREGVTLFMTLLAAFQVLLQRYTGQDDIAVGAPIAGRTRAELEPLVGFFVNTLLLRGDLSGDPTFRTLLGRVRQAALGAYAHQDLPFERLVEELRPERSLAHTPLFQVMFALQNLPRSGLSLPGLTVSPVALDAATVPCDLTMTLAEDGQELSAALGYDTDLFDAATIDRMLAHFRSLLAGAAADPDRRISSLPLLSRNERRQILAEWNDTRSAYPHDRSIPGLFEEQVARTPGATAVSAGNRELTYRELAERANRLAHHLRKRGVGPGTPVGICMDRSPEMVVGLLGILKAGGAYVPLDPTYPEERLAFMLEDSGARVLVTEGRRAAALRDGRAQVVRLDSGWAEIGREPAEPPAAGVTPESLAYVIYTSGSTGTPKGVAVPHRAVVRLVMNTNYVTVTPSDVMAQVSNTSFDAATFEIWGALLNGARLEVLPKDVVLSSAELAAALERHRVTLLFLTTALFNQMARAAPSAFRGLRCLLFGGESVEPRWVEAVLRHGPPERLLHVYGPTEATTFATWHHVRSVPPGTTTLPIGRPISNTEVYLLDRWLNSVPVGVPGELHIGGPGLARGYLNRPELTPEKFIRHPFSEDPAARLYKTGDVGRYLPDGSIEFLGRLDHQIKIRGFRVEPGEIEAALNRHPGVREAVVVAREDTPGDKRLVAYVVPAGEGAPHSELQQFLSKTLPPHMVPACIATVDRLPLTPNGKVDRGALPAPPAGWTDRGAGLVMPSSPLQHQLAQIWEELLNVRPVGLTDNFFELGGHSLLAVRMVHEIERVCGRTVSVAAVFSSATLAELEQALIRESVQSFRSPVTAVQGGSKSPFFFLHGDFNGGGFYCANLARMLGPEQPFYALHPHGLDGGSIPASIEEMAEDHLANVRAIQPHGPYFLGELCNGGLVAFEMARQLRAQGEPVALLAVLDAVARGPRLASLRTLANRLRRPVDRAVDRVVDRVGYELRALDDRWQYYRRRLREVARSGFAAQVAFARKKLVDSTRWLVSRSENEEAHERLASARAPWPRSDWRTRARAYRRAVTRYSPGRYGGRVTLFVADEGHRAGADLGWRAVAEDVDVHVIPGEHLTFITRHVQLLGERLRACLEEAQER